MHAGFLVEKPLLDVIKFIYKCNLGSAAFYYRIKEYSQALWHSKRYVRTCTNNLDVILVTVRFDKFCVLDQNVFIRMYCASSEN